MVDSGALCHMTGNSRELREIKSIIPISIGLPNGTNTIASHQGTVTLGGRLRLNNVLYVPTLQCKFDL